MSWPRIGRWIVLVDMLVVAWIIGWVALGIKVRDEARGLTALSTTISRAGGAVEDTGRVLDSLDVPLVGGELDRTARRITGVGGETRVNGIVARDSISNLSTLLGVSIALIPSSVVLLLYLPARVTRVRERRAMRRLVERFGAEPAFQRMLAHRALMTMSYRVLERDAGERPWVDLAEGRYAALAADERRRLDVELG